MARSVSYFCPGLNCIQMGAWKHSPELYEKHMECVKFETTGLGLDTVLKLNKEKNWKNYG